MTVDHVKVHQIYKAESLKIFIGILHGMGHTVGIAFVIHILRQSHTCENIMDLAHADGGQSLIFQSGQKVIFRRFNGKIMAVSSALEAAGLTHKRSCNHSAHAVLAG